MGNSARRSGGFTLLELLLTLVIMSVAILSLMASTNTGLVSVSDSINQRAAREVCRAKLEEAVASGQTSGGGPLDAYPGFQWSLSSQETATGASDSPTERYVVVTVTVNFPQDASTSSTPGSSGASTGGGTIKLSTIMNPPDLPPPGSTSGTNTGPGH